MLETGAIDVHTEVFEGPLDLLLYLIKKDNLDIYDIPIAQITQEYLSYLDVMKELNLDTAGEFLLMAATLMQIKVRMLLPSQAESEQDQGPDPRVELAAKLAEYEKYKAAALVLDARYDEHKDIFYRGSPKFAESEKLLNLDMFDLLSAVKRAFESVEDDGRTLSGELFPIETRMEKIVSLLAERDWILLDDVFKGEKKRLGVITCFMALLELIKQNKIFARQDRQFGEIRVYLNKEPQQPQAGPASENGGQAPGTSAADAPPQPEPRAEEAGQNGSAQDAEEHAEAAPLEDAARQSPDAVQSAAQAETRTEQDHYGEPPAQDDSEQTGQEPPQGAQ